MSLGSTFMICKVDLGRPNAKLNGLMLLEPSQFRVDNTPVHDSIRHLSSSNAISDFTNSALNIVTLSIIELTLQTIFVEAMSPHAVWKNHSLVILAQIAFLLDLLKKFLLVRCKNLVSIIFEEKREICKLAKHHEKGAQH